MSHELSTRPARAGVDWRKVAILYRLELRSALREKTIVINSLLIPIFLYPFLLWAIFTGVTFVTGQSEKATIRVAVKGWPEEHPRLRLQMERQKRMTLVPATAATEAEIQIGKTDALVEFTTGEPVHSSPKSIRNFKATILYNQALESSAAAHEELARMIRDYRQSWMRREARQLGISSSGWEVVSLETRNMASRKQMGAFILSLLAPVIFVAMVAVACFYPAVDCTAGERERQTWETLMSTSANRLSVVTAKYLYVASMGVFAGTANVLTVLATAKPVFAPLLQRVSSTSSFEFTVSPMALPVVLVAAVLLAGFIAAGMMLFAAFARTFKEGQAMITPFYMLNLVPIVFLQVPGLKLTWITALIPVANLTLMVREALAGTFQWPLILLAVLSVVALVAILLRLAARLIEFEDVMLGSYNGSLLKFIRQRLWTQRPSVVTK
jgi:ABC-type Na+ efflux pump permease subunit